MKGHLLLIEDDELLGSSLLDNLQMENYSVDWIRDGDQGLTAAQQKIHDILILDINLPKKTGLEILKELRKTSDVPVLILSARGSTEDRIAGLELRADDYLPKPFHFLELNLRIQSLLRRTSSGVETPGVISIGQAEFDFTTMTVQRDGATDVLTEKEILLLRTLLSNQNQVTSREKILDQVWGVNEYPSPRTVDNMIVKLRKWIEPNPGTPNFIRSYRGVGYALMTGVSK